MLRASIPNTMPVRCSLLIFLLFVCSASVAAQQSPKLRLSPSPRLIILPPQVIAGAPAMLAVLDSRGRLLPKIELEISGGQKVITDVTGRALFNAPSEPGTLVAKISGRKISSSAKIVEAEDSMAHEGRKAVAVTAYPQAMTLNDRFILEGSGFQSEADSNRVSLNGEPCLVVASSPVSLVVLPGPGVAIGDAKLKVAVGGTDVGQFTVSVVTLEFSGPSSAVNAGSAGNLILRARGTTLPLTVEVRNGSPRVIQLTHGNVQRLKTSGGEQNIAPIDVNFVTDGNYSVSARLISPGIRRN